MYLKQEFPELDYIVYGNASLTPPPTRQPRPPAPVASSSFTTLAAVRKPNLHICFAV